MTSIKSLGPALDGIGIGTTTVCLIHCIAVPVLALLGTAWSPPETIGTLALALSGLVGAVATIRGFRHHKTLAPLALAALGIGMLGWGERVESSGQAIATVLTVIGGAVLIGAHLLNRQRCRCCRRLVHVDPDPGQTPG